MTAVTMPQGGVGAFGPGAKQRAKFLPAPRAYADEPIAPKGYVLNLVAGDFCERVVSIWRGRRLGEYLAADKARRQAWHACMASGHADFSPAATDTARCEHSYELMTFERGKALLARAFGVCPPGLPGALGRLAEETMSAQAYGDLVAVLEGGGPCAQEIFRSKRIKGSTLMVLRFVGGLPYADALLAVMHIRPPGEQMVANLDLSGGHEMHAHLAAGKFLQHLRRVEGEFADLFRHLCAKAQLHLQRLALEHAEGAGGIGFYVEIRPAPEHAAALDLAQRAYQLIGSQGQGNVFQYNAMRRHVLTLVQFANANAIFAHMKTLELSDLLDFLGAKSWESFCCAYLIAEEGFLPTGLSAGGTLSVLDLIGRRVSDGVRLYAQCKKSSDKMVIDDQFLALAKLQHDATLFYFAYGGVVSKPSNVRVFTKIDALNWAETAKGRQYVALLCR